MLEAIGDFYTYSDKLTKKEATVKIERISQYHSECIELTHKIIEEMEKIQEPMDSINIELSKDETRGEQLAEIRAAFKGMFREPQEGYSQAKILQPLNLMAFDGDYANFPRWFSMFKALVHSTNQPDIVKFSYLQQSLSPIVLDSISHITFGEENYEDALISLRQQYDKPLLIQERVIESLIEYPIITSNYAKNLRGLLEKCRSSLTTLRLYGFDKRHNGIFIISLLRQKLPAPVKRQWALRLKEIEATNEDLQQIQKHLLDDFLEFLDSQTTGEEAAYEKPSTSKKPFKGKTFKRPTMSFAAQALPPQKQNQDLNYCFFCEKSGHLPPKCRLAARSDPMENYTKVKKAMACVLCLEKGHSAYSCPQSKSCGVKLKDGKQCQKRHHRFLHLKPEQKY